MVGVNYQVWFPRKKPLAKQGTQTSCSINNAKAPKHLDEQRKLVINITTYPLEFAYERASVSKLIIIGMKLSLTISCRIDFQSKSFSPRSVQMDSSAILTAGGGLGRDFTSERCCFLIDFTASRKKKRSDVSYIFSAICTGTCSD